MNTSIGRFLSLMVLSGLLTSCSSFRGLYDAGAAGAGGVIAHTLSDGDPLITGTGAAGGVLVSELIQSGVDKSRKNSNRREYDRGKSDAVKQQYWIIQNLHKRDSESTDPKKISYYPVPAESSHPGINEVPHQKVLRIEE